MKKNEKRESIRKEEDIKEKRMEEGIVYKGRNEGMMERRIEDIDKGEWEERKFMKGRKQRERK